MSTSADELKLVHPDHHDRLVTVASGAPEKVNVQQCSGNPYTHRTVDVVFHTYADQKLVRMELSPHDAYEKVSSMANTLIPGSRWRIFSGNEIHVDAEFTNSRQVWDAIQRGIFYDFYYLHVRQIKYGETARCDGCYREIYGNRYKCTTCSDFDLCGSCEIRGMHPYHKLLKI